MAKEQDRGPRNWQQERSSGGDNNWGGPPRRSFGQQRSDGPPRFSSHRPSHGGGGGHGGPSGGFDRDRPPRRTFRRQDDEPQRGAPPAISQPAAALVAPRAMTRGIQEAKAALAEVMASLLASAEDGLDVESVEATVSFAADGKFMGFGKGGAASLTLTMSALDAEDTIELDDADDDDQSGAPAAPTRRADKPKHEHKHGGKDHHHHGHKQAEQARQGDHAVLASDEMMDDGDVSNSADRGDEGAMPPLPSAVASEGQTAPSVAPQAAPPPARQQMDAEATQA